MPFGCITLGDKKDYNNSSDVTDKYDLGQTVKTEEFCEIFRAKEKSTGKMYTCKKFLKKDGRKVRKACLCLYMLGDLQHNLHLYSALHAGRRLRALKVD
uniref:Uncharacterized protein n=1 Tax=Callorhinchus milii TaxID=7868 RepID=A0A4W3JKY2_CALMI